MRALFLVFGVLPFLFVLGSCNRYDPDPPSCDYNVMVDEALYKNGTSSQFTLSDVKIVEDCLTLTVTSSGCSGDSWKFKLVDSGAIAESYPVQRYMRFLLTNNELCDAVITKKVSFNLTSIRVGVDKVIIHLKDWDESLLYTY
jgi:hypothetical protein